jgi:hypothetical protein
VNKGEDMPKTKNGYELHIEDASHLGGPMGTEYTTTISKKSYLTLTEAKQAALKYVRKHGGDPTHEIKWNKSGSHYYSDERFVIVTIKPKLLKLQYA